MIMLETSFTVFRCFFFYVPALLPGPLSIVRCLATGSSDRWASQVRLISNHQMRL
jgi:hypothetical protein